jgi:hypothetical protein
MSDLHLNPEGSRSPPQVGDAVIRARPTSMAYSRSSALMSLFLLSPFTGPANRIYRVVRTAVPPSAADGPSKCDGHLRSLFGKPRRSQPPHRSYITRISVRGLLKVTWFHWFKPTTYHYWGSPAVKSVSILDCH